MFKNLFKKTTPEEQKKKEEEKRVKKEEENQKLKDRVVELNEKYKDYVDQFILIQTKNKYELAVFKDFLLRMVGFGGG
jgi:cell division protein FtsB